MNECTSLLGRLFGHNYQECQLEVIPPTTLTELYEFVNSADSPVYWSEDILDLIDKLSVRRYMIRCQRCGQQPQ